MEGDALRAASFGGGLFLTDFPAKIRVLTLDPMVSNDNYGNTRYGFIVWNHTEGKAQIINKGPSFAKRFQEIHMDEDFGGDLRKVDIKITVSGKGKETRYTITPVGSPYDLSNDIIREAANIKLESAIKNGVRLSEVNQGKKVSAPNELEPQVTEDVIHDVPDDVDINEIPF